MGSGLIILILGDIIGERLGFFEIVLFYSFLLFDLFLDILVGFSAFYLLEVLDILVSCFGNENLLLVLFGKLELVSNLSDMAS